MIVANVVIILVTRKLFATFLFIFRQFGRRWGGKSLSRCWVVHDSMFIST